MKKTNYLYMTNSKFRYECIICESSKIKTIIELQKMPVFMGANKGVSDEYSDMTFQSCSECGNVQIKEIIDPSILYLDNHNIDTVGNIWNQHYIEFSEFAKNEIIDKNVLEIGDPSYKISSYISNDSKKWNIVEINPNFKIQKPEKVNIIKKYFDDKFEINEQIDVVIHSHVLEHISDPIRHLKFIFNILKKDGKLIFSIPNLNEILKQKGSPNSALHFEHTYFYTEQTMSQILTKYGFEIDEIKKYENHSLFFKCSKKHQKDIQIKNDDNISKLFIESKAFYENKVKQANEIIKYKSNVYLYGCHVSSQFIINIGLNTKNIKYILDNSKSKDNYKLYGTDLTTKQPSILENEDSPIVILFHTGIYSSEIIEQLKKMNKSIIFI